MYNRGNDGSIGLSLKQSEDCSPNYESMAAQAKKEIDVIKEFQLSLLKFIDVIGNHSFREVRGTIPELVGEIQLDLIVRNKRYDIMLSKISKADG